VLVTMAVLATFDPWYRRAGPPRPWLGYLFFVISVFAPRSTWRWPLIGSRRTAR